MRIIGSMVMKNEADRYLEPCLKHALSFLDEVFVFDDMSTDDSRRIASDLGCRVVVRSEGIPSFIEHESDFRSAAWGVMEQVMVPGSDTWIFSFDADEFMVSHGGDVRGSLSRTVEDAHRMGFVGVKLHFPEIFEVSDGSLFMRVDGFWGDIRGPRLFRYCSGGVFSGKAMGSGSEPTYVGRGPLTDTSELEVLHLGYAKDADKSAKYERYSALEHGHNDQHIQSIVSPPSLRAWGGVVPKDLLECV